MDELDLIKDYLDQLKANRDAWKASGIGAAATIIYNQTERIDQMLRHIILRTYVMSELYGRDPLRYVAFEIQAKAIKRIKEISDGN